MTRELFLCFFLTSLIKFASGQQSTDGQSTLQAMEAKLTTLLDMMNTSLMASSRCDTDIIGKQEWKLAFRGTARVRKSVYFAYLDGTGSPVNVEPGCMQVGQNLPCSNHYRNSNILDNWHDISEIAFVVYKNNIKVKQVIFDGSGSTYMNWFDKARVKYSTWTDMKTSNANIFSIFGHQATNERRTFFMNNQYGYCQADIGWFVALDNENGPCPWDRNRAYPAILYSTSTTKLNWNNQDVTSADYFAVFVRYFNVP